MTSAPMNVNPLKVQIEYTDAKGERITVDKDVAVQISSFTGDYIEGGSGVKDNSSGMQYMFVLLLVAGGVFFIYRRRKQ